MIDQYWSRASDEGWDGWSTALPMVGRSISPFVATQHQPDPRAELQSRRVRTRSDGTFGAALALIDAALQAIMLGFLYVDGLHGFVVMLWIMALALCPIITVVLWLASLSFSTRFCSMAYGKCYCLRSGWVEARATSSALVVANLFHVVPVAVTYSFLFRDETKRVMSLSLAWAIGLIVIDVILLLRIRDLNPLASSTVGEYVA